MPEDLDADYYLRNFIYLIEFVVRRYREILSAGELDLYQVFSGLPVDTQKLYVRLISRKGPLFRSDKLQYDDIQDLPGATRDLLGSGLIDTGEDAAQEDLLALLTRDELAALLPEKPRRTVKRPVVIAEVLKCTSRDSIHDRLEFTVLRPCGSVELRVFKLLFFGNLHQDLTDFVLHELGVAPFESYEIDAGAKLFSQRTMVDEMLALHDISELSHVAIDEGDSEGLLALVPMLPDRNQDFAALGHRFDRIVNRMARQMEREQLLDDAMALYDISGSPPARERVARILHGLGRPDAAMDICNGILATPCNELEYEFAAKFLTRILDKGDERARRLPRFELDLEPEELVLQPAPECSVEELVRRWAEEQGYEAHYVENRLFRGMFGLAFWDVIFAPVDGAFFHPFQRGPADLFQSTFASSRTSLIKAQFARLWSPGQLSETILGHFESKRGLANHFVHWETLTASMLESALSAMPVAHVLAVFQRLLNDLQSNRSGLPDLILFRDGAYRLLEVKGPGDRLQQNQQRWFRFFASERMPAGVVNVSYGVNP